MMKMKKLILGIAMAIAVGLGALITSANADPPANIGGTQYDPVAIVTPIIPDATTAFLDTGPIIPPVNMAATIIATANSDQTATAMQITVNALVDGYNLATVITEAEMTRHTGHAQITAGFVGTTLTIANELDTMKGALVAPELTGHSIGMVQSVALSI